MKKRLAMIGCALAVVLFTSLFGIRIQAGAAGEGQKTQAEIILELQNAYRAQAGLAPLQPTAALQTAAGIRVTEAAVYFSHVRPDGSPWWTVDPVEVYGENLYRGDRNSAESIVNAWMSSPAHRSNILSPEYTTCGIALVFSNGRWVCAQEFGY